MKVVLKGPIQLEGNYTLFSPFPRRIQYPYYLYPYLRLMHYKLYLVCQIREHMTSTRTGPEQLREAEWAWRKWDDEKEALDEVRSVVHFLSLPCSSVAVRGTRSRSRSRIMAPSLTPQLGRRRACQQCNMRLGWPTIKWPRTRFATGARHLFHRRSVSVPVEEKSTFPMYAVVEDMLYCVPMVVAKVPNDFPFCRLSPLLFFLSCGNAAADSREAHGKGRNPQTVREVLERPVPRGKSSGDPKVSLWVGRPHRRSESQSVRRLDSAGVDDWVAGRVR